MIGRQWSPRKQNTPTREVLYLGTAELRVCEYGCTRMGHIQMRFSRFPCLPFSISLNHSSSGQTHA